jgi:RNA polymerase sigma-70 factor (ECF subfamily)
MEKEFDSLKQLFQQEFAKMVAVISKQFGLQHIELAEDIVSDTFLTASETWGMKGIPPNPNAWLYSVAKQKTLYHFRRHKIYEQKVVPEIKAQLSPNEEPDVINFSQQNIRDSQLQMLFAICNPVIASEAQIGLALRILCGFGIDEIAEAFFTNKETINKRLFRAKEKLREGNVQLIPIDNTLSDGELSSRLDTVLHIIYLLFSEGYYSKTQNQVLRKDLCLEALRLGIMLTEFAGTNQPKTNALLALMCFHASRFTAREDSSGSSILYEQQNEELWDKDLIRQGEHFLSISAQGPEISSYHLEAAIAHWHCQKEDTQEKWDNILRLYDLLLQVNYSPGVALNRTFALYKAKGRETALAEALQLNLDNNHFYFTLLGELYKTVDNKKAKEHFERAYSLAKTQTDKQTIRGKIDRLV